MRTEDAQEMGGDRAPLPGNRPADQLPGGLNLQLVATGLLVLALLAIAWLFLADSGEDHAPASPTATPQLVGGQAAIALTRTALAPTPQPTLATAMISATGSVPAAASGAASGVPSGIAPGGFVRVSGTGIYGLRLRFGAGPDYATIRIVPEGEVFRVLGGPESSPPDTFWRVQDAQGNIGWAAEAYLAPVAPPAQWNPPPATPVSASSSGGGATATP